MNKDYHELLNKMKIEIKDERYYLSALTHISYRNEHPNEVQDYDRLEFIGDAILNFVIADLLYRNIPEYRSGKLSKTRSFLVKGESLSEISDHFDVLDYAYLSRGEENNSLDRSKLKEDIFEALIGATYLDRGFDYTYGIIKNYFLKSILDIDEDKLTDGKSKLQELLQRDGSNRISYQVVEENGTAQDKEYVVEVLCNDVSIGHGRGNSKKSAEQKAACDALIRRVK